MSELWHGTDYVPEERFEIPLVLRRLEDMDVPSEAHQLPAGVADPFEKMEAVFDVAAAQMDAGRVGTAYMNGKPRPSEAALLSHVQTAHAHEHVTSQVGNKQAPAEVNAQMHRRREVDQERMVNQATAQRVPKASGSTKTAADGDLQAAASAGGGGGNNAVSEAMSAAAVFIPMAAGQAIQSVVQGPLPVLASQAVNTAASVISAGNVVATGIAEGLREEPPLPPSNEQQQGLKLRRGLRQRV